MKPWAFAASHRSIWPGSCRKAQSRSAGASQHRFWGRGYVTEAASRLLEHGLTDLGFPEIYAFAVHDNTRSIGVMQRIGMIHLQDRDFDHPKVPDTHPQLKRHVLYRRTARISGIAKTQTD